MTTQEEDEVLASALEMTLTPVKGNRSTSASSSRSRSRSSSLGHSRDYESDVGNGNNNANANANVCANSNKNSNTELGSSNGRDDIMDAANALNLLASPNSIAEAAYKAGVEHRRKRDRADADAVADANVNTDRDADADSSGHSNESGRIDVDGNASPKEVMDGDNSGGEDSGSFPCKTSHRGSKRRRRIDDVNDDIDGGDDDGNQSSGKQELNDIWKHINTALSNDEPEHENEHAHHNKNTSKQKRNQYKKALSSTKHLLLDHLDQIIQKGLESFNQKEDATRELIQLRELCESRQREIQRLRQSEHDSRTSLSNLLQAVEASKNAARDLSRSVQTEAKLRADVSSLRSDRDRILTEHANVQRQSHVQEEELRMLKLRVGRLTQERIKVERDSRAALSLAKSMSSGIDGYGRSSQANATSDVEYYKRKVHELNGDLQSKNGIISELKYQVEECRGQLERQLEMQQKEQEQQQQEQKQFSNRGNGNASASASTSRSSSSNNQNSNSGTHSSNSQHRRLKVSQSRAPSAVRNKGGGRRRR